MSLVGTICCRTGEPSDFETCMTCAIHGDPEPCQHPFFLLKAMRDNKATREDAGLSATTIMGCPRFHVLAQEHDYHEDPSDYYARFRGTVLHGGIEQFAMDEPGVISEERYFRSIDVPFVDEDGEEYHETYEISGKMDVVLEKYKVGGDYVAKMSDMKSGGRRSLKSIKEPLDSHVEQINIYRWILAHGRAATPRVVTAPTKGGDVTTEEPDIVEIDVQKASIWYLKDEGMVEIDVPLWPIQRTEDHIRELLIAGKGMKLPPILPNMSRVDKTTGEIMEVRHWKCNYCPLRSVCDTYPAEGVQWFEGEHDENETQRDDDQ